MSTWHILDPVSRPPAPASPVGSHALNRSINGVRVGFQVDYAWHCYSTVLDEWQQLLATDGATSDILWNESSRADKFRKTPEQIAVDVDDWARLVDCCVTGLGN